MTGVNDAVVGALFGGLGGYGAGRLSKHFDGLNLYGNPQKQEKYFNDYIKGLNDDTPLGKESAFSRELSNFRGLKEGINNGNSNGYYDVDNSLHRQQADLINEYNPAPDTYHTWIRGAEDIQTPHTLFSASNPDLLENPDWTLEDMQKALKTGNVTIYSSYPIDNGVFVTPSEMEALSYSGNGKVYQKTVPLESVAWIDSTQGQYAPIQPLQKIDKHGNINLESFEEYPISEYERSQFNTFISPKEKRKVLNRYVDPYRYVVNKKAFDRYTILDKGLIDDSTNFKRKGF